MGTLLLLGLVLSLDSFRVSLGLGTLRPRPVKQLQIVAAFGFCDGLAPLVGMAIGQSLGHFMSRWAGYLGPALLALCGLYVLCAEWRHGGKEPGGWIVLGLPLSLSLDNVLAGASLTGLPVFLCVVVLGGCSALASLAGLRLGRTARDHIAGLDREWIGGVALIAIAVALAWEKS